ncbi:kinase-like domain-containing protein [Aspergillus karnatakaensis]|uniref:kinase-like domain-containing protein n=1 Tax=Aspergillus karnatakaensis TaxID=1810916 RepID=UPI003CCD4424
MDDTDFAYKPALTSWLKDDGIGTSAVPAQSQHPDLPSIQESILEFLSIAQALEIDILPITWQAALPKIGEGATAYIWQSPFMEHARFAFKRMRPAGPSGQIWNMRALIAELLILGQRSVRTHPFISPLQGISWEIHQMTGEAWPVLVFGKANNGDMHTFMEGTVGPRVRYFDRVAICFQIGDAVRSLHELGVIHGDIKPQNVLVFGGGDKLHFARISDFGYSTLFASSTDKILMPQSLPWTAPEYQRGQAVDRVAARKMDVYSFGLLCLWFIFYNVGLPRPAAFYADMDGGTAPLDLALQKIEGMADQVRKARLREFFKRCLSRSPEERPSDLSEVLRYLGTEKETAMLELKGNKVEIPIMGGDFQLSRCAAQLYSCDYKVREYIARCFRESLGSKPLGMNSKPHALQYAMCLHIGFGVSKDQEEARLLLTNAGISTEEFERALEDLKSELRQAVYHESGYQRLLLKGYDLCMDYSTYYAGLGRSDEALAQTQKDMRNLESFLGRENPLALSVRSIVCNQLIKKGEIREVLTLQEEDLEILRRTFGVDNVDTIRATLALAATYVMADMVQEADSLLTQLSQLELQGLQRVDYLRMLSSIRSAQGRSDEAVAAQSEPSYNLRRELGSDNPDYLEEESRLCTMLIRQKNYEEPGLKLQLIVETCKNVLGQNHNLTMTNTNNLAYCYDNMGEYHNSVPLYRELVQKEPYLEQHVFEYYVSKLRLAEEALKATLAVSETDAE